MIRNSFFKLWLSGILLFCLFACNESSAQAPPQFDQSSAEHVAWQLNVKPDKNLKVGDIITLSFTGTITTEGWHLYSSKPTVLGMGYTPTEFLFYDDESKSASVYGKLSEDKKPKEYYDDIMQDTVREFKDRVITFSQKIKITGENPEISAELAYQVCKDACIFTKLPFKWSPKASKAEVVTPAEKPSEIKQDTPAPREVIAPPTLDSPHTSVDTSIKSSDPGTITEGPADPKFVPDGGEKSDVNFWLLFLKAFVFGFAALLTPCVFPMIPLTVTFFTKQNEKGGGRNKGIFQAVFYGLSIIGIYTGLGLTLAALFGDDVMYKMSINPWVNLGFFIMLMVFALSFLGMFEITLPASWVNKMDAKSERGGLLGVFFMALTLALVSFSCTGPIVGTALIEAADGGRLGPAIAMLGFSSAIAIPFALFAIFPHWMNSLPQSGGWLNSVKVVLGLFEIALGLKFLSQTDLYMEWHLLDREIFLAAWIVIFSIIGLYLLGKLRLPHDSPVESLSVPRLLIAMTSLWFVIYLIPGLWGARLPLVSGLLPPPNTDIGVKVLGQKELNAGTVNGQICDLDDRKYLKEFEDKETHGFCTFYDIDEAREFAQKVGKPLFLDFTGVTCANCRKVEQTHWPVPNISKMLKEDYVMVSLYADKKTKLKKPEQIGGKKVRTIGDKWLAIQKKYFKMNAQPYYVLIDPKFGIDDNRALLSVPQGYTGDRDLYNNFLKAGIEEYNNRK